MDGQILQLKIHSGEFAPDAATAVGQPPLIPLGNTKPLHVRVDVDENEASRLRVNARATGYLRGDRSLQIPLHFVRFESYILPKKSLTGDTTERIDTRVLQVIFTFQKGDLPIFVGQQMDVLLMHQTLSQTLRLYTYAIGEIPFLARHIFYFGFRHHLSLIMRVDFR